MPKRDAAHMGAQREKIIRAAIECIADKGIERSSISDICERAELSAGALYVHFSNKDEIIVAALHYGTLTETTLPDTWEEFKAMVSSLEDQLGLDITTVIRNRLHLHAESARPGKLHDLYKPFARNFDSLARRAHPAVRRSQGDQPSHGRAANGAEHQRFHRRNAVERARDRSILRRDSSSFSRRVGDVRPPATESQRTEVVKKVNRNVLKVDQPKIVRTTSRSSAIKSKKAAMRAVSLSRGCVNSFQVRANSGMGPSTFTSPASSAMDIGKAAMPMPDFAACTNPRMLLLRLPTSAAGATSLSQSTSRCRDMLWSRLTTM